MPRETQWTMPGTPRISASSWPAAGLAWCGLAYGLTGDRWLAEDIAQSALASAFAAWWRVRRAGDPDAYVRRILINTSNRRFRKHRVAENPRAPAVPVVVRDGNTSPWRRR